MNDVSKYPLQDVTEDVFGQSIEMKKSSQLKPPHTKINLTKDHLKEWIKCKNDVLYFAEKYYYIVDPDLGLTTINLYEYQKEFLLHIKNNRHVLSLQSRQVGKSTIGSLYLVWEMTFFPDKRVAILANKEKTAKEIFGKIKIAYENLPNYLKCGLTKYSETGLSFDNGSSCIVSSTSSSAIRGLSINCLMLDEMAFIPDNMFMEFYSSVYPTIAKSKNSKIIAISTANGLNHFHKMWVEANDNQKNGFAPFEVKWDDPPDRDEEYKKQTIAQVGEHIWKQEYENCFLGSVNTLISSKKLETMVKKDPIKLMLDGNFQIFEKPEKEHLYLCGVDTSKGVGRDYSIIQVLDVSKYPFKQVAIYKSNNINPFLFGDVVFNVATMYNNAFCVVENNSEGGEVCNQLWYKKEYINIYNENRKSIGFRTTKTSKSTGVSVFKELIENDKLIINDLYTINELSSFILHSNNAYKASKNMHDDAVMALIFLAYFITTDTFKNYYKNSNFKNELYADKLEKMETEFCLPIGKSDSSGTHMMGDNQLPDTLKNAFKKEGICFVR